MPRHYNTQEGMGDPNINPRDIGGKSSLPNTAGHEALISPGAGDPKEIQKGHDTAGVESKGVVSEYKDVRTSPVYTHRDSGLTAGGEDGSKSPQFDPITGKSVEVGTHAPSTGALERGDLYGTQSSDREGFSKPTKREVMKEPEHGPGTSKSPKQR